MHKSDNTILIWVLSWAGLLLALLYSPLGSPELYHKRKYFNEYQGVNFSKITIANAKKSGITNENDNAELLLPTNTNSNKKNYNYSINATGKSSLKSLGKINIQSVNTRIRENAISGGSGGSGTNTGDDGSASKQSSQRVSGSSTYQIGGIASSKLDLSLFGDSTVEKTKQYAQQRINQYAPQSADEISNPGEDPLSDPIPVGDGWIFLIFMAGIYVAYKLFINRQINQIICKCRSLKN